MRDPDAHESRIASPHPGGQPVEGLAQLGVGKQLFAEDEPRLVRVPRVVEDELGAPLDAAEREPGQIEGLVEIAAIGVEQDPLAIEIDAAEIRQDARHLLGVVVRVPQRRAARPAVVVADEQGEALDLLGGDRGLRHPEGEGSEGGDRAAHYRRSLRTTNEYWS